MKQLLSDRLMGRSAYESQPIGHASFEANHWVLHSGESLCRKPILLDVVSVNDTNSFAILWSTSCGGEVISWPATHSYPRLVGHVTASLET
jgi:hypothetical protein